MTGKGGWFAEIFIEEPEPRRRELAPVPQPLPPKAPDDPVLERLRQMRYLYSRDFVRGREPNRVQAASFCRQARFMADFADDYGQKVPFEMYFPEYQRMSYAQLRTYFSWRTKVRCGIVEETSLSYVFVYIYELINQIAVKDCEDGLEKLLFIWRAYRPCEPKLDRYLRDWVRDYYIVNDYEMDFYAWVDAHPFLRPFFPREEGDVFALYAPLADYKWNKSAFCTEETDREVGGCFRAVAEALDGFLREEAGIRLEDVIFYYTRGNPWTPFARALYYDRRQPGRRRTVKIDSELYYIEDGQWRYYPKPALLSSARPLLGYLVRTIEQFYRTVKQYRHKLSVSRDKLDWTELERRGVDPQRFFDCVDRAIRAYYRQSQRITVTVDPRRLAVIRESAQRTQERLLAAEEQAAQPEPSVPAADQAAPAVIAAPSPAKTEKEDVWAGFFCSLPPEERRAVRLALEGGSMDALLELSRACKKMPEVLIDSLNERALDAIGDNIIELTDRAVIYEDYRDELERVIHESE